MEEIIQNRQKKLYFHWGHQAEEAIKSTYYCIWKEVVVIKTMIVAIKAKIVIMIKIILVTMITIAI